MSAKTTIIAALLGVATVAGLAGSASAESRWDHHHPRQNEVLTRVHREERAARVDYRYGLISRHQAIGDIRADRRVAREDRFFARANGGYITHGEQHFMNRQENGIGRRVY